jgi:hypothetical protein
LLLLLVSLLLLALAAVASPGDAARPLLPLPLCVLCVRAAAVTHEDCTTLPQHLPNSKAAAALSILAQLLWWMPQIIIRRRVCTDIFFCAFSL